MPPVVTATGRITCIHQGTVAPVPGQSTFTVAGQPVLVGADLGGATIGVDCLNKPTMATPTLVQCTATGAPPPSALLTVAGTGVLLATAGGATNSTPPGTWKVVAPGQTLLNVQG
jgi:hypothetical protein